MRKIDMVIILVLISFLSVSSKTIEIPSDQAEDLSAAIMLSSEGDTILVKEGKYRGSFELKPGTSLISQHLFKAELSGKSRKDVLKLKNNCYVEGFDISGGLSGITCRGAGIAIIKNKIHNNSMNGIRANGALPAIKDNIVVFNSGSGIQAYNISTGADLISHNTIAYNGNHGMLYSGTINLKIENNILAYNKGQAFRLSRESDSEEQMDKHMERLSFDSNIYYDNHRSSFMLPSNNYVKEPMFTSPKFHMNFSLKENSPAKNRGNDNDDIGARYHY